MFGLTKREQRWKAEQKAAETLIPMITAIAVEAMKQDDKNAEISALRADNTRLQNEVVMPLRDRIKVLEDALRAADAAFEAVEIFMPDGCKEEFAFYADWEDVRSALGDKMPNV